VTAVRLSPLVVAAGQPPGEVSNGRQLGSGSGTVTGSERADTFLAALKKYLLQYVNSNVLTVDASEELPHLILPPLYTSLAATRTSSKDTAGDPPWMEEEAPSSAALKPPSTLAQRLDQLSSHLGVEGRALKKSVRGVLKEVKVELFARLASLNLHSTDVKERRAETGHRVDSGGPPRPVPPVTKVGPGGAGRRDPLCPSGVSSVREALVGSGAATARRSPRARAAPLSSRLRVPPLPPVVTPSSATTRRPSPLTATAVTTVGKLDRKIQVSLSNYVKENTHQTTVEPGSISSGRERNSCYTAKSKKESIESNTGNTKRAPSRIKQTKSGKKEQLPQISKYKRSGL